MRPIMVRGSPLLLLLLLATGAWADANPEANPEPEPQPQDPQNTEYQYSYDTDYGEEYYGSEDDYYTDPVSPDEDIVGIPAPPENNGPETEAARYDYRGNRDPCAGVFCPDLDCPTRPYIPQGECCPVCPGQSNIAPVRPDLQENYNQPPDRRAHV